MKRAQELLQGRGAFLRSPVDPEKQCANAVVMEMVKLCFVNRNTIVGVKAAKFGSCSLPQGFKRFAISHGFNPIRGTLHTSGKPFRNGLHFKQFTCTSLAPAKLEAKEPRFPWVISSARRTCGHTTSASRESQRRDVHCQPVSLIPPNWGRRQSVRPLARSLREPPRCHLNQQILFE